MYVHEVKNSMQINERKSLYLYAIKGSMKMYQLVLSKMSQFLERDNLSERSHLFEKYTIF